MDHHGLVEEALLVFFSGLLPSCAALCGVVGCRGQFPPRAPALPSEILFLGSPGELRNVSHPQPQKDSGLREKGSEKLSALLYVLNGRIKFVFGVS